MYKCLCGHGFHSIGHIPRSGIAGSYDTPAFTFPRNCQIGFHRGCNNNWHSYTSATWGFQFPLILANFNLKFTVFLITGILVGMMKHLLVVLIYISLMMNDAEILHVLLVICKSSLGEKPIQLLCPLKKKLCFVTFLESIFVVCDHWNLSVSDQTANN